MPGRASYAIGKGVDKTVPMMFELLPLCLPYFVVSMGRPLTFGADSLSMTGGTALVNVDKCRWGYLD